MKELILFILLVFTFNSCLEPLDSSTYGEYTKQIVVDGGISNESGPYTINLSYTKQNIYDPLEYISGASVYIIDDTFNEIQLTNIDDGTYVTPLDFRGEIGRSYKLKIITQSSYNVYESDFCMIKEPTCIDNIGLKAQMTVDEITNTQDNALIISIGASACSGEETFIRWTLEEDWVFDIPNPLYFDMVGEDKFEYKSEFIKSCYLHESINKITLYSFKNQSDQRIIGKDIYSIIPNKSTRFTKRYRARIKQHSISENEFDYWRKLKDSSEDSEDLFGKQPFSIESNIKCTTSSEEKVMGYFQVSGIAQKDIYITPNDIKDLNLKRYYQNNCQPDSIKRTETETLYDRYLFLTTNTSKIFYSPVYDEMGMSVIALLFTTPSCATCEANQASKIPPTDWVKQ